MKSTMSAADWSLLLIASLFLGSTFLFLNMAVAEISPLTAAEAKASLPEAQTK